MIIFDPKTLLIAASLISGGSVAGVSALDGNALEAVHEAMGEATDVVEAEAEVETELEIEIEVEAAPEAAAEGAPADVEVPALSVAHPGRRALGENGRGATHRSPRATQALETARARSPLTNRGAAHRSERATAAIERACDRSASRPSRGPSENRGMNRGKGRGHRS